MEHNSAAWDNSHLIARTEIEIDEMKTRKYSTWLALPLVALFWAGAANASTVIPGIAVGGTTLTDEITPTVNGKIEYYIPLRNKLDGEHDNANGDDNNNGIYGVTDVSKCGGDPYSGGKAGLCQDKGRGSRYDDADALQINIFFDLSSTPEIAAAELNFWFKDLDLGTAIPGSNEPTPGSINDPKGFFESMSLSYWDGDGAISDLDSVATVYHPDDFTVGTVDVSATDPITWSLDLAALGILTDLKTSRTNNNGFWIQIGFGAKYLDEHGNPKEGWNTPEQLTASLTVSPVPLPSAVWLFGSALLGFISMSRRTRV